MFVGAEGTFPDQGQTFEQTGCGIQQQHHRGCGQCVRGRWGSWTQPGWTETKGKGV